MIYQAFVIAAISEDDRNVFTTSTVDYSVPSSMIEFYKNFNPQDVEISYPGLGAVKFYPVEELKELNSEYDLDNNTFVFATSNGDPLFIMRGGGVFTTLHGIFKPEKVASSFIEFLNNYITSR